VLEGVPVTDAVLEDVEVPVTVCVLVPVIVCDPVLEGV
jgi:hypothetical protein